MTSNLALKLVEGLTTVPLTEHAGKDREELAKFLTELTIAAYDKDCEDVECTDAEIGWLDAQLARLSIGRIDEGPDLVQVLELVLKIAAAARTGTIDAAVFDDKTTDTGGYVLLVLNDPAAVVLRRLRMAIEERKLEIKD